MKLTEISITRLLGIVTAIGALGMASFSLVDATKAFNGGVSAVGCKGLKEALTPFSPALELALGGADGRAEPKWQGVIRAHWINGRPREEQKAIAKGLIRLGLAPTTAPAIAAAAHADAVRLTQVSVRLESGDSLSEADVLVLGRLDASVDALLDAAFDRADQLYRNVSRLLAGVASLLLSFLASYALGWQLSDDWPLTILIGLLAVPVAPVAKDLASSLQAAATALRSAKP